MPSFSATAKPLRLSVPAKTAWVMTSAARSLLNVSILIVPAYPLHREIEAVLIAAFGHKVEELVGAIEMRVAMIHAGRATRPAARSDARLLGTG
jgi:hypothetical protein